MSNQKYKVIVSDRAKQMLGAHIHFIAQINKEAAKEKKKELMTAIRSLGHMPHRFPFLKKNVYRQKNTTECLLQNGILFFTKFRTTRYMWSVFWIADRIIAGCFIEFP